MIHRNFADLERDLKQRVFQGMYQSIITVTDAIPVDTMRAFTTVRVEQDSLNSNKFKLIVGGEIKPGVLREIGILKPVNYAIFIEARTSFLESSVPTIIKNIKQQF